MHPGSSGTSAGGADIAFDVCDLGAASLSGRTKVFERQPNLISYRFQTTPLNRRDGMIRPCLGHPPILDVCERSVWSASPCEQRGVLVSFENSLARELLEEYNRMT